MKVFLMYRDRDFDLQQKLPPNEQVLIQDLELNTLFNAMARGDEFLFDVARKALLLSLHQQDAILYRQDSLKDCLKNPSIIITIYNLTLEIIESERKNHWGIFSKSPNAILHRSIKMMQTFMETLKKIRRIADEHANKFESEGFMSFFSMIQKELNDDYFNTVEHHLRQMQFRQGVLISTSLATDNKGFIFTLRQQDKKNNWMGKLFAEKPPAYAFSIADRDDAGNHALSELKDKGLNAIANALAQSNDHILSFFNMLRVELAFYVGCLNLHEELTQIGEPLCFPVSAPAQERKHTCNGLYDISLALTMKQKVVGNDLQANHKNLLIVTGANQGGKTTFLRSIGLSQLMMQSGMFVPAEAFCANIFGSLFTHYRREEDATMTSGKLDEELNRMNTIVDNLTSNAMVLFNESFAATNEREGSEIARQIVRALLEKGIKIFFVTHLYEFAHGLYEKQTEATLFLRAERQTDGRRTFKLAVGEPLQTSYGKDVYQRIFEEVKS